MSLDAFVGKKVDTLMVVIEERQGSEGTIRLKCPKPIINELQIPEKGYLTVHIKGYHRERSCQLSYYHFCASGVKR
jgi:hypothetical protein